MCEAIKCNARKVTSYILAMIGIAILKAVMEAFTFTMLSLILYIWYKIAVYLAGGWIATFGITKYLPSNFLTFLGIALLVKVLFGIGNVGAGLTCRNFDFDEVSEDDPDVEEVKREIMNFINRLESEIIEKDQ